jgi:hypothetical protein
MENPEELREDLELSEDNESLIPIKMSNADRLTMIMTDRFQDNQRRIEEFYSKYLEEHKKTPTNIEISTATGLTRQTIWNHFRRMKLESFTPKHKILFDKVLTKLSDRAIKDGDIAAIKLYLQVVGNFKEGTTILSEHAETKTLRIEFMNPEGDIKRIEKNDNSEDIEFTELNEE